MSDQAVVAAPRWRTNALFGLAGAALLAVFWLGLPRLRERWFAPRNLSFVQITDQPGPELFPSVSPDGKSLAYASRATGRWDIYLMRSGGGPINLTRDSTADNTQPAFSPDGRQVAFRSEREGGGIFLMSPTGESVRRLTEAGFNPVWSPDGKEILVATESITRPEDRFTPVSRLWAINVQTGAKRLVGQGDAVQPHWSPHGHRIAYWASKEGQRDIWTVAADGTDPVAVTQDAYIDWNPVWAPSGQHLYFISSRGGSMNLWRVAIDERSGKVLSAPTAVTTPSSDCSLISVSQNGRRIVYTDQIFTSNLYQVAFDPVAQRVVGRHTPVTQGFKQATRPDLSPDGRWLAFGSWGRQEDIFVVRTDGSGLRQLTDDFHRDRGPRWSPDGHKIAFFSNRSGKFEIWTIRPDGTDLQQVTHTNGQVAWPVWAPDSRRLVYTIFGQNPFLASAAQPKAAQASEALPAPGQASQFFNAWSWSPDGQKLAGFLQERDGTFSGIAAYSLETRSYARLTEFGMDPIWLSDSRRLLFNHHGRVCLVDSATRKVQEVLSIAPYEIARRGFAISRDDRAIYFSLATTEADLWMLRLE